MSGGIWQVGEKKDRAGFFMRFVAAALASIGGGTRGVIAIPVRANWGPPETVIDIQGGDFDGLNRVFGTENDAMFTAARVGWLALLGGPKLLKLYRMVDGTEEAKTFILADGTDTQIVTLTTKYPTTKDFRITTRDYAPDVTKSEIRLYEGTTFLKSFVVTKSATIADEIVDAINTDTANLWLTATKIAAGNGTLNSVSSQTFTGGNAGTGTITNTQYSEAMAAFEAHKFNGFVLDGATDGALQATVKAWIQRLRDEGKNVRGYVGGSETTDQTYTLGNTRSLGFNFEGIINVIISAKLNGVTYPSSEVAAWVAGLVEGQALTESPTFAPTPFDDVTPRLTDTQITESIKAGSFMLTHDGEKVIIEKGINTLTSIGAGQNKSWKKIKIIKLRDAISEDISTTAKDAYIGKIPNNLEGQTALLAAIKKYFETLQPSLLATFTVDRDEAMMKNADSDEFYWIYDAEEVDNMEKIYGTGRV